MRLNHSFQPNVAVSVHDGRIDVVVLARDGVVEGQELCFDYNTTEWDMAEVCKYEALGYILCRGVKLGV